MSCNYSVCDIHILSPLFCSVVVDFLMLCNYSVCDIHILSPLLCSFKFFWGGLQVVGINIKGTTVLSLHRPYEIFKGIALDDLHAIFLSHFILLV